MLSEAHRTETATSCPTKAVTFFPTRDRIPGGYTVLKRRPCEPRRVIARLENSASCSAHLHFHIVDGPEPFSSEGVPFVFDEFTHEDKVYRDEMPPGRLDDSLCRPRRRTPALSFRQLPRSPARHACRTRGSAACSYLLRRRQCGARRRCLRKCLAEERNTSER
jgi:hypothetical protein